MGTEEKIIKKDTKIIIGDEEFLLDEDYSMDEILEMIKENPAYSNATEDNCFVDDDGNLQISQPKSKTNGTLVYSI